MVDLELQKGKDTNHAVGYFSVMKVGAEIGSPALSPQKEHMLIVIVYRLYMDFHITV